MLFMLNSNYIDPKVSDFDHYLFLFNNYKLYQIFKKKYNMLKVLIFFNSTYAKSLISVFENVYNYICMHVVTIFRAIADMQNLTGIKYIFY